MKRQNTSRKPSRTYRGGRVRIDPMTTGVIIILVVINIILCVALIGTKFGSDEPKDTSVPTVDIDDITLPNEQTDAVTESRDVYADYTPMKVHKSSLTKGSLVLVNITHSYDAPDGTGFMNLYSKADRKYSVATSSLQLLSEAYDALNKMTDDYYTEAGKKNIQITAAYRTVQEQQKYYDAYVTSPGDEQYCEKAGYSDHHTGLAFDVKLYDASTDTSYSYNKESLTHAKWVVDNHPKYGFIMRFPSEKFELTGVYEGNHFRYVGIPHAAYITENQLCLDEYVAMLKNYTLEKGVLTVSSGEDTYTVYYTASSGEDITDVYVPTGKEYEISGDNSGGYIVWYKN